MPTADEKKVFCDALGLRIDQVRVERIPHPTKRAHLLYKVWHPHFGEGVAALEHEAWQKFFDAAEKQPPLPTRCQARKKDGTPCQNAPQAGEQYCGPHLAKVKK
jgi:hypothetical protein